MTTADDDASVHGWYGMDVSVRSTRRMCLHMFVCMQVYMYACMHNANRQTGHSPVGQVVGMLTGSQVAAPTCTTVLYLVLVTGAWYDGRRAGYRSQRLGEFKLACSCVSVRSTGRKVALVDAPDKGRVPH